MITQKLTDALNKQVNAELYSAYLYLAMSAWGAANDYPGLANWMRIQYQEETAHGMHMFDYIDERDGRQELYAVAEPPREWKDPLDVFQAVLAHEQKVTALIGELATLAMQENDHAAYIFMQWYVREQVEEEKSARDMIAKLKKAVNDYALANALDDQMAARVFTDPFANANA